MMHSCVIWIFQLTFKYLKCWTTQEVNSAPFPFFLMLSLSQTKGFTGCGDWHMLITGNLCCPNLPYDGGATFYFREARASLAQLVKNPPAMWETWVWSLGWEDPLEKGKATHSSVLAWRIPWTIQSMGSQTAGHNWVTFTFREAMATYLCNVQRKPNTWEFFKKPEN